MKNSISFCVFKIPQNQSIEKLTGNALEGFILFQTVMHSGPENLSLGHTSSDRSNEFGVHCPLQCVLSTAHDRWSTSVCVREGDTGAQKEQQLSEI